MITRAATLILATVCAAGCAGLAANSSGRVPKAASPAEPTFIGYKVLLVHSPSQQQPYLTFQVRRLFSNNDESVANEVALVVSRNSTSSPSATCYTDDAGNCSIGLIKNLGLAEFSTDATVTIRCTTPNQVLLTHVRPSQWLQKKYRVTDEASRLFYAPEARAMTRRKAFRGHEYLVLDERHDWVKVQVGHGDYWLPRRAGRTYWGAQSEGNRT